MQSICPMCDAPTVGDKYCERCWNIKYREKIRKENPETAFAELYKILEPLYVSASLNDLPATLVDKITTRGDKDLVLWGPVGVGKTHTMAALIRFYYFFGFDVMRINYDEFLVRLRSTYQAGAKETECEVSQRLKDVDKLFIDDLGLRGIESEFAKVVLFDILNKRQERLLQTFITTNKPVGELAKSFDVRIASRLQSAVQVALKGVDRRIKTTNGEG